MQTVVKRASERAKKKLVAKMSAKKAAQVALQDRLIKAEAEVVSLSRLLQVSRITNSQELSLRLELKNRLAEMEKDLLDSVSRGLELKAEIASLKEERDRLVTEALALKKELVASRRVAPVNQ
jgi:chromosome segregation ATPase